MSLPSLPLHRAIPASAEAEQTRHAHAVLDQMYAYFSWDDLPFTVEAEDQGDYALVA